MPRQLLALTLVFTIGWGTVAGVAATLTSEALAGWTSYVTATERRIHREQASPDGFLGLDFGPTATADRRALFKGATIIRKLEAKDDREHTIDVPGALVHDWRGAVFIPGITLDALLAQLEVAPVVRQDDVLAFAVLERGPHTLRLYLKLQRTKIITVVYNTEHDVVFERDGPSHASSVSRATKIAELDAPNTPNERELPPGEDRGLLWRWNAYWRYEDVGDGVLVECESVSLSRTVPMLVRFVVAPFIERTARESMERTLVAMQRAYER
jgi:hypothetical protein